MTEKTIHSGPHAAVERLGKNRGRYLGETIDIDAVLQEIESAALAHSWSKECLWRSERHCILAYHRRASRPGKRLYISAGIHGDEPAGPVAVRELLQENHWPAAVDVWLCPCLNPTGFPLNSRENAGGLDLNRQYLEPQAEEIRAHTRWLDAQPAFDITLSLHEDWEAHGFYVYELNVDTQPLYAEAIVRRISEVCPIDRSPVIEGREAHEGIIRPSTDLNSRPQWPEAFYLIKNKTRASCTLEAPSDFPLNVRVAALKAGVQAVLEILSP